VEAVDAGKGGQVTQYLVAGVPDLLDRYAGPGGDPYGQAIIAAAMDVGQLGHASPLPAALLQEAAVGYLTDPQRTKDIASWRDVALAWASEELKGTVRALQPVPSVSGTGIAGYQAADYLIQYATRKRRSALVPDSTWKAVLSYVRDPADAARLADSASYRELYDYAIPLYRRAADAGDSQAARTLVRLLAERGDLGVAATDDQFAAARLADLCVRFHPTAHGTAARTRTSSTAWSRYSLGPICATAACAREMWTLASRHCPASFS
jgi:hypothetical protein